MSIGFRITKQLLDLRAKERSEKLIAVEPLGVPVSQCDNCIYRERGTLNCDAYPEGIPLGFLVGELDHSEPYEGDHGITYVAYGDDEEIAKAERDVSHVPRDQRGRWTENDDGPAGSLMKGYSTVATEKSVLNAALTAEEQTLFYQRQAEGMEGPTTKEQHTLRGTKRYTPERLALHRKLINKMIDAAKESAKPSSGVPKVIVLGGRGGSGKSNFDKDEGTQGFGAYSKKEYLTLDADGFKELLAKEDGLPGIGNHAFRYHAESGDLFDKAVVKARRLGLNVVLDVTLNSAHLERVEKFKQAGYTTAAYYMHLPPHLAAQRAVLRWKQPGKEVTYNGRLVPPKVVLAMRRNEINFDKVARRVDEFSVYRNDVPRGERPIHVAGVKLES